MNDIAANIRTLRRKRGMSQEQLAQALHVTRQTVSAWERGLSRPGLDALGQIARALEAEEEQLLYGPETGKRPGYRGVSFWPVLGIIPLFYVMIFWLLPWPMSLVVGTFNDAAFLLCGQLFLAIVTVFCYCSLKDEIRNRDFCAGQEQEKPEEKDSEKG